MSRSILFRLVFGKNPRRTFIRAIVLAGVVFVVARFLFLPVRITGISMEPTFHDGTLRVTNQLKYKWRDPRHGEIVVISTTGTHALYLKRILGVPGDRIRYDKGLLYVNGIQTPEPYLTQQGDWTMEEIEVPADSFFVAGDNRSISMEWHLLGLVHRSKIAGGLLY